MYQPACVPALLKGAAFAALWARTVKGRLTLLPPVLPALTGQGELSDGAAYERP